MTDLTALNLPLYCLPNIFLASFYAFSVKNVFVKKSPKKLKKSEEERIQKSEKIIFLLKNLKKNFCLPKKTRKKIILHLFCQLRRLVFDQSSPVHPVLESRGVTTSVTKSAWTEGNPRF